MRLKKLLFLTIAILFGGFAIGQPTTCYPTAADYNTGSTDGTSYTETSLVNAYDTEHGYMMFDITAIPDGATITSIEFHGYVNNNNWPYWALAQVTSDPFTATAADMYADIDGGPDYNYNQESGDLPIDWYVQTVGTPANADLQAALVQDWFVIGIRTDDHSSSYFIDFDGWDEAHVPYIIVDYTLPGAAGMPVNPNPADAAAEVAVSGNLTWDFGADTDTYDLWFGEAGSMSEVVTGATAGASGSYAYTANYNTDYEWQVIAYNSGGTNTNGPVWSFHTVCGTASVPYIERFDGVTAPAFPPCMAVENTNGDTHEWATYASGLSSPNSARITYNSSLAMDDWFFTEGLDLTAGVTYEVSFAYLAASASYYPERLAVDWGTAPNSASMSGTPIFDAVDFLGGWYAGNAQFTPTTTGTYYVGFHGHSLADEYYLYVDDVAVLEVVTTTTWTGAVDNDWWTAGNWSSGIPTSGTVVAVPGGLTNYPTVNYASQCFDISVASGASLLDNGLLLLGGVALVDRDYTGNQWHLISSPVSGPVSGMFNGLYLQGFTESTNLYGDIVDVDSTLTPGVGFALWNQNGNATATYTGSLVYSATRALTRSAAGANNGWNLVGNPYPSSIDWEAASGWTKTNVAASTYRFSPSDGNWAIWNGTTGTLGATQYIASGQGFFVSVNDDGSTTGSLGFSNGIRVHDNTTFYKEEPADIVKLKVSGNNYSDETAVYFREEATTGFDDQMDAHNLSSFFETAPDIYSTANGGMAINVLPEVTSVPMNVKVGVESGTFTIETISNGEFSNLYLEDISTGVITDLNKDSYTFDYIPGIESRFVLHFGPLGVDNNTESVYNIYSFNKEVYVAVPLNTTGTITAYDMMGQEVTGSTISSTVNTITLEKGGYYVVKVVGNNGVSTKKVFIK
jgi:hypothetical protein